LNSIVSKSTESTQSAGLILNEASIASLAFLSTVCLTLSLASVTLTDPLSTTFIFTVLAFPSPDGVFPFSSSPQILSSYFPNVLGVVALSASTSASTLMLTDSPALTFIASNDSVATQVAQTVLASASATAVFISSTYK
jgi:hypothetical protein